MKNRPLPFAGEIRRRMQERGLGLREFCRAVGLDPSFFSKVLSGKRSPPSDEADLRRIADVLELDAPGLIVSAGRIPSEWEKLWQDRVLFDRVHELVAGKEAPPRAARKEYDLSRGSRRMLPPGARSAAFPAVAEVKPLKPAARSIGNWGREAWPARPGIKKELGEELL